MNIAKKLAGIVAGGLRAAFDGAWNTIVQPLVNSVSSGLPGDAVAVGAAEVKQGLDNLLGAKDAAAKSGGVNLAGIPNSSGKAALQAAAAKLGWPGAQWSALEQVEMAEAGFSLTATNPSSGAYGMAQFINGPSEYAQYGGNSTSAAGQAVAMVNYSNSGTATPRPPGPTSRPTTGTTTVGSSRSRSRGTGSAPGSRIRSGLRPGDGHPRHPWCGGGARQTVVGFDWYGPQMPSPDTGMPCS